MREKSLEEMNFLGSNLGLKALISAQENKKMQQNVNLPTIYLQQQAKMLTIRSLLADKLISQAVVGSIKQQAKSTTTSQV
jgi:hypothetical protein